MSFAAIELHRIKSPATVRVENSTEGFKNQVGMLNILKTENRLRCLIVKRTEMSGIPNLSLRLHLHLGL